MKETDVQFYMGMNVALAIVHSAGQDSIYEEIVGCAGGARPFIRAAEAYGSEYDLKHLMKHYTKKGEDRKPRY